MHHIDESYQGDIEVDLLYLIQGIVSLTRKDLAFEFVTNCHQLTFNVTVLNTHLILLTVGDYLYLNLTHNPP